MSENSLTTSSFFTDATLQALRKRPAVAEYLQKGGLGIYNINDMINKGFIKQNKSGLIRGQIVHQLSSLYQATKKTVTDEYIDDQLHALTGKSGGHDMDILILTPITWQTDGKGYQNIHGVAIVEWGECADYNSIPALKLIFGKADILLYSYIYALGKISEPKGILELAGAFDNMRGLCAYNKFGFREDFTLKTNTCFGAEMTLPMSVDVHKMLTEVDDAKKTLVADQQQWYNKDQELSLLDISLIGGQLLYDELDKDGTSEPLCDKQFLKTRKHETLRASRSRIFSKNTAEFNEYHNGEIKGKLLDKRLEQLDTSKKATYESLKNVNKNVRCNDDDGICTITGGGKRIRTKKHKKKKSKKKSYKTKTGTRRRQLKTKAKKHLLQNKKK